MSTEQRKIRRKLPPIPADEKERASRVKGHGHAHGYNNNRKNDNKNDYRTKKHLPSSTSQSDESMNEEDKEVARIIKRRVNDLGKPSEDRLNGNIISSTDSGDKSSGDEHKLDDIIPVDIPADIKPCMRRSAAELNMDKILTDKEETDLIIDSLINIYGAPITQAMKSLKRRLQDELRRVTENRRRKIEELEEIRALQLQIGELKLGACALTKELRPIPPPRQTKSSAPVPQIQNGKKRGSPYSTPRASPQVLPRRSRHKRQSSDPMISKFSPIKEDKDIEADFQMRVNETGDSKVKYATDDSSQSGLSDSESSRSEPSMSATYKKLKPSAYAKMILTGNQQEVDKIVSNKIKPQTRLKSQSESQLLDGKSSDSSSTMYLDSDEKRAKEEKKQLLQYEIEKRKKKLEETVRLQSEIIKLTRAKQALAHSYDDIPKRSSHTSYTPPRPIPTGIIKPIDDEDDTILPCQVSQYSEYEAMKHSAEAYLNQDSYSSSEYLAHKQETARRHRYDDISYSSPYLYSNEPGEDGHAFVPTVSSKSKPDVRTYSAANVNKDCMSSSMTLPELHSNRSDLDFIPTRDNYVAFSDTEASPASDYTPAMPLLDDVKARSRKIIHDIGSGSRPVSAEFNFADGVEGKYFYIDKARPGFTDALVFHLWCVLLYCIHGCVSLCVTENQG